MSFMTNGSTGKSGVACDSCQHVHWLRWTHIEAIILSAAIKQSAGE